MTDNKDSKIVLEREYNVPLRRKWLLVPKYKRAKKAVKTLRDFIAKHMKSDDVKLGRLLNMSIWKDGIKNPPHHVEVLAKKNEEGVVTVVLKSETTKTETKKEAKAEVKDAKKAPKAKVEDKVEEVVEEVATEEPVSKTSKRRS